MCWGTTCLNISKAGKFSTITLPIKTVKSESKEFWSVKLDRKVLFGTSCKSAKGPLSSKWVGFTRSRYALWLHQCRSLFWLLDVISDASNFRSTCPIQRWNYMADCLVDSFVHPTRFTRMHPLPLLHQQHPPLRQRAGQAPLFLFPNLFFHVPIGSFSQEIWCCFFFQAEDGIRDRSPSRGLGDVYKRQHLLLSLQLSWWDKELWNSSM